MSEVKLELRRVILESPYAGDVARNVEYARRACRDSLIRGEAPMVSHLLYTQPGILDDTDPKERQLGISAGLVWGPFCAASVFYADYGFTPGMLQGFDSAQKHRRTVEIRLIGMNPKGVEDGPSSIPGMLLSDLTRGPIR